MSIKIFVNLPVKALDETVRQAVAAGGSTYNEPQDHGFIYQRGLPRNAVVERTQDFTRCLD